MVPSSEAASRRAAQWGQCRGTEEQSPLGHGRVKPPCCYNFRDPDRSGRVLLEEQSDMSDVIKVNDGNFDAEVMNSQQPVLLDFSATWCGPCKQLEPLVEELAREYKGRLKVGSVDVEEAPNTSMRFGVISVPTLILIKNGQVHGQQVGALPKTKLADWVAQAF